MARSAAVDLNAAAVARGGVAGLAAFGLGYVLTYTWRAPAVADSLRGLNFLAGLLGVEAIPTWKGVGWLFYGAHGVTTTFPLPGGAEHVNLVEQSADGTVALLYVLVPALLVLAGLAAAWLAEPAGPAEGAVAGAAVAVGYLVAAAVGTVLFAHGIGDTGSSIAPDLITGVLLAGVVYPVAFGAAGGALSGPR